MVGCEEGKGGKLRYSQTFQWTYLSQDHPVGIGQERVVKLSFSTEILCQKSETSSVDATVFRYSYTISFTDCRWSVLRRLSVNANVYWLSVKCHLPTVGKYYSLQTVGSRYCVGKVLGVFTATVGIVSVKCRHHADISTTVGMVYRHFNNSRCTTIHDFPPPQIV